MSPTSSAAARTPPRRIAVLGAGGFLGSHLVPALLARGAAAIDAVDVTFDKLAPTPGERVRRIQARIDRPGLLDELTERCEVVLSLTAICTPARYNRDPMEVIDASYTDLVPLVKLCAQRRRWLVHFSTCEVYGRRALDAAGGPSERMSEDGSALALGPVHKERWSYACAKQLLERVIWAHGQHAGLPFTIVRPFNVIGPRMDYLPGVDGEGVPRVLASFMNALLRGEPLPLVAGGHQRRSFIAAGDFCEGVLRILERPATCQGEILNLGNPANDVSVRALAEALSAEYARCVPGAPLPPLREVSAEELYGPGYDDSEARVPETSKVERLLDFRPPTSLAAMLPGIVADYVARYRPLLAQAALRLAATASR
jgi:UDP-apiose/xylose synthase